MAALPEQGVEKIPSTLPAPPEARAKLGVAGGAEGRRLAAPQVIIIPAMDAPKIGRLTPQAGWIGAYYPILHGRGNHRNPHAVRYGLWKDHVRAHLPAGLAETAPTRERPLRLDTFPVFRNGQHPDAANVRKGVEDALWRNDKYAYGMVGRPRFDKENPRVICFVGPPEAFEGFDVEQEASTR